MPPPNCCHHLSNLACHFIVVHVACEQSSLVLCCTNYLHKSLPCKPTTKIRTNPHFAAVRFRYFKQENRLLDFIGYGTAILSIGLALTFGVASPLNTPFKPLIHTGSESSCALVTGGCYGTWVRVRRPLLTLGRPLPVHFWGVLGAWVYQRMLSSQRTAIHWARGIMWPVHKDVPKLFFFFPT